MPFFQNLDKFLEAHAGTVLVLFAITGGILFVYEMILSVNDQESLKDADTELVNE